MTALLRRWSQACLKRVCWGCRRTPASLASSTLPKWTRWESRARQSVSLIMLNCSSFKNQNDLHSLRKCVHFFLRQSIYFVPYQSREIVLFFGTLTQVHKTHFVVAQVGQIKQSQETASVILWHRWQHKGCRAGTVSVLHWCPVCFYVSTKLTWWYWQTILQEEFHNSKLP